jgi:hypothetical protein
MHVKTRFGIAIARILQRMFGSALVQKLLTPNPAARARNIEKDFALPIY